MQVSPPRPLQRPGPHVQVDVGQLQAVAQLAKALQKAIPVGKCQTGTQGQAAATPGPGQGLWQRRQEQERRPPRQHQRAPLSSASIIAGNASGEGPRAEAAQAEQDVLANVRGGGGDQVRGGLITVDLPVNPHPHTGAAAQPARLHRTDGGAVRQVYQPSAGLVCITWNAANLTQGSRELALINLLEETRVDIAIVTETELPSTSAEFKLSGYVTFSPIVASGGKTRVLVLVCEDVATKSNARLRKDLMTESVPSVWIQLDARVQGRHHHSALLLGGLYRQ
jgi:hypothetical protein